MSTTPNTLITSRYAAEAEVWLDAKSDFEHAKEALDTARETLVSAVSEDDGPYVIATTEGPDAVALTDKDRRNFDADKLTSLVSRQSLIDWGVVKLTVDPKQFDLAVKAGKISAKVVSKVVESTSFVDVRKVDKPAV